MLKFLHVTDQEMLYGISCIVFMTKNNNNCQGQRFERLVPYHCLLSLFWTSSTAAVNTLMSHANIRDEEVIVVVNIVVSGGCGKDTSCVVCFRTVDMHD
jgi:hypothetical protein